MALFPTSPLILRVAVAIAALRFFTTGIAAPPEQADALISTPLGAANVVHAPRPEDDEDEEAEEIYSVLGAGVEVEHPFMHDPAIGVSWKLWIDNGTGPVQFEWTWKPEEGKVWWDLSMIDAAGESGNGTGAVRDAVTDAAVAADSVADVEERGEGSVLGVWHPFSPHGLSLQPHRDSRDVEPEGVCSRIDCSAGEGVCWQAYNIWNDWGSSMTAGRTLV